MGNIQLSMMNILILIKHRRMLSNKKFADEKKAMILAAKHGLLADYLKARRNGYSISDALEDWDIFI